ncbi:MAG TPA: alpha-1,4-glucan--maltose-1-phosphate maltosyltransferase [Thermoanaerobaculia bacterium]|nr:alpha-1,4-glucan--maltose-1-phosphate maltosyltransferase [Thermoanaerobaculia bacterium]
MNEVDGRKRVIIEGVSPEIDAGRFPIKRVTGEGVVVEADVFADGHDAIEARLLWNVQGAREWNETRMESLPNDRWRASFETPELGMMTYTLEAWVDHFLTWRRDLVKRIEGDQDLGIPLKIGASHVREAAGRAAGADAKRLEALAVELESVRAAGPELDALLEHEIGPILERWPDRRFATRYGRELSVVVDRPRARFSTWYEMFPRSTASRPGRHGTFRDAERRLPYVASMGFDVLYLPPIHPIGTTNRKGPNNAVTANPGEVGSPWAIGAKEGGHTAIHPELGTLEDFRHFVEAARSHGIEVALDVAFQTSPDHPWVEEHPDWFLHRPDGTVQFAENPPKKYEDIYPFYFESERWKELWEGLRGVFQYWIDQGVLIFRVDNPHTKPLPFWEWCIGEIRREHPDVIFLAEAFTRPRIMYWLAKAGFTQSYTYFAWRNTSWELRDYFTDLTRTEVREYFRPNVWPNTPDILTEYLQHGGRAAFIVRIVLAGTLAASYGIYGPAFELGEHLPRHAESEEYLDSEKYQIRTWNLEDPRSISELISRVNRARREHEALQSNDTLVFHGFDNDQVLVYSKTNRERSETILVVVNLDPYNTQSGWTSLDLETVGIAPDQPFQVHDLLTDARYSWHGPSNYVELNPHVVPAHVFRVRHRVRSERDFDYYL